MATSKKAKKKTAKKKTTVAKKRAATRKPAIKPVGRKSRKITNVMVAVPSYSGHCSVYFINSLLQAIEHCRENRIRLVPQFRIGDSLVQRARNDLFRDAVTGGETLQFDAMVFIDDDMQFQPEWIFDLVTCDRDVVGGTARKKTDDEELYCVKTRNLEHDRHGLIQVFGLGTGLVKLSRKAFTALWEDAEEYENDDGTTGRMVCDVQIVNGQLYSEDTYMYLRLMQLGFEVWLNPNMTCGHVGSKLFTGDFANYRERLLARRL